jgi:ABC transporter, ATP-binding protein
MAVTAGLTGVGAVLSIVPYVALTEIAAAWSRHAPSSVVWGWLAAGVAGLFLGHALYSAGLGLTHVAEARLRHRLRRDIVATLARIPLGTVDQTSSGAIRKIVCDDTTSIHTLVAHLTGDATNSAVTIAAGVAYLLWVDWRLTLVIVALWVLLVGVVAGVAVSGFGDITERFGAAQTRLAAATVEMVEGIKEIKNFQASESARTRFTEAREGFSGLSYEWTMASGRAFAIAGAFLQPAVVFATVAPVAALFVAQDWIEPAYALPFFFLSLGIPAGLMTLMQLGRHLYEARQAARTTAELLSIPAMPEGEDVEGDGPAPGAVELSGVTFGYDPEEPVVRDVSLSIPPGSVTALVGPSGGGEKRPPSRGSSPASTTSTPAASKSEGSTCATSASPGCSPASPSSSRMSRSPTAPSRRT